MPAHVWDLKCLGLLLDPILRLCCFIVILRKFITAMNLFPLCLILLGTGALHAQDGALDPEFNGTGIAMFLPGTLHDVVNTIATQSDGKIIVGGVTSNAGGFNLNAVIGRINSDGSLDETFGTDGWFIYDHAGEADYIYDLVVLPNDQIVACGAVSVTAPDTDILVVKLDADGIPLPSFGGGDGMVIYPVSAGEDYARDIKVLSDDHILLAGVSFIPNLMIGRTLLMKLLPNGSPDNSFGNGGSVITAFGDNSGEFYALDLDEDGNIYGAGAELIGFSEVMLVQSFLPDGSANTSFSSGGIYTAGVSSNAYSAVWTDNHLVVGGKYNGGGGFEVYLLALSELGVPDADFGTDGQVFLNMTEQDVCLDLTADDLGRILIAGTTAPNGWQTGDFLCMRFLPDGTTDIGFADNGVFSETGGIAWDDANALCIQEDGKILLAGFTAGMNNDMLIMRLGYHGGNSVMDQNGPDRLSVFPNPVSDVLVISSSLAGQFQLKIIDALGRMVDSENFSGNGFIDCSFLSSGRYHVILTDGKVVLQTAEFVRR
jgi:uncharacterized delta-60 repeat protein